MRSLLMLGLFLLVVLVPTLSFAVDDTQMVYSGRIFDDQGQVYGGKSVNVMLDVVIGTNCYVYRKMASVTTDDDGHFSITMDTQTGTNSATKFPVGVDPQTVLSSSHGHNVSCYNTSDGAYLSALDASTVKRRSIDVWMQLPSSTMEKIDSQVIEPFYQAVDSTKLAGLPASAFLQGPTGVTGNAVLTYNSATGLSPLNCSSGELLSSTGSGWGCIAAPTGAVAGSGGIGNIGMTVPSFMSVSPTTLSADGTFALSLQSQAQSTVFAAPTGGAGQPGFRALAAVDIPTLDVSKIGSGVLSVDRGGTGLDTSGATAGQLLIGNGAGFTLGTLSAGAGISITNTAGGIEITSTAAGVGTVTNVGLSMPSIFAVSPSGISSAGTFGVTLANQIAAQVFAAPTGASGAPSFRSLAATDLPALDASKITSGTFAASLIPDLDIAKLVSGTLSVNRGGTGLVPAGSDANKVYGVNAAGTNSEFKTISAGAGVIVTATTGAITISATGSGGTVTNVGLSAPTSIFSVSNSPVTSAGTMGLTLANQSAAQVFAAPTGASGAPSFRSLAATDIPTLDAGKITSGTFAASLIPDLGASKVATGTFSTARIPSLGTEILTSGTLGVTRGGTGLVPAGSDANKVYGVNATGTNSEFKTISAGAGVIVTATTGTITISATGSGGTVTNVGLSAPTSIFSVSNSPVTSAGTLGLTLANQSAAQVFAAPTGASGAPSFRSLAATDIPTLDAGKITSGTFAASLIPDLDASKIATGTFSTARIPSLSTDILSSGTLGVTRGGTGLVPAGSDGNKVYGVNAAGSGSEFKTITAGTGVTVTATTGTITISATGSGGTVTNIGASVPTYMSVSPSSITTVGTFAFGFNNQTAGMVFAAPTGATGAPSFRALAATDIPALDAGKITSGTLSRSFGGTGLDTSTAGSGKILIGTGSGLALNNLTPGSGIGIMNGSGAITISTTIGTLGWAQGGNSFGQAGILGTNDGQDLQFITNGIARATFTSGGSIGFGRTSGPLNSFEIAGTNRAMSSATEYGILSVMSTSAADGTVGASISLGGNTSGSTQPTTFVSFEGRKETITANGSGGFAAIRVSNGAATPLLVERFRITANGNVGIGTTAPSGLLHVSGGELIVGPLSAASGDTGRLQLRELAANGTNAVSLRAPDSITTNQIYTLPAAVGASGTVLATDASGNMSWTSISVASGTVTNVGLSMPAIFSVSPSGISTAGTFSVSLANQTAAMVFAAPTGATGAPSFRALASTDIPSLDASAIGTGTFATARIPNLDAPILTSGTLATARIPNLDTSILNSGTLGVNRGGTGVNASAAPSGQLLIGNGSGFTLAGLTAGTGITILNSAGSIAISATAPTGTWAQGGNSFGQVGTLGTNDGYGLSLRTANTDQMFVDTTGKVGIGTTSPSSKLHISSTTGTAAILVESSGAANRTATLSFKGTDASNNPVTHMVGAIGNGYFVVDSPSGRIEIGNQGEVYVGKKEPGSALVLESTGTTATATLKLNTRVSGSTVYNSLVASSGAIYYMAANGYHLFKDNASTDLFSIDPTQVVSRKGFRVGNDNEALYLAPPRMPTGSLSVVAGMPAGSILYDTTAAVLKFHNGTAWSPIGGGTLGWAQGGNSFGQTGVLGTSDANDLKIRTNATDRIFISSGGSVGIGTTSPMTNFHIYRATGDSDLLLQSNETGKSAILSFFTQGTGTYSAFIESESGEGNLKYRAPAGASAMGDHVFLVAPTGDVEALRIKRNGLVGIGTKNPSGNLNIHSAEQDSYITLSTGTFNGNTSTGTINANAGIRFYSSHSGTTAHSWLTSGWNGEVVFGSEAKSWSFKDKGGNTEYSKITPDGLKVPTSSSASGENGMIRFNGSSYQGYYSGTWSPLATGGSGDFKADGTVAMTGALVAATGSAAAPSITFSGATSNGLYSLGTSGLAFAVGGADNLRLQSGTVFVAGPIVFNASGTLSISRAVSNRSIYADANSNVGFGNNNYGSGPAGLQNTAVGALAMFSSSASTVQDNVAVGYNSGYLLSSGKRNTLVGSQASTQISTGSDNVIIGYFGGSSLSSGSMNVAIGSNAGGTLTTGTGNIAIGANVNFSSATITNELNIGNLIKGTLGVGGTAVVDGSLIVGKAGDPRIFVPPRMPNATLIATPGVTGAIAYDSDNKKYMTYNGTSWVDLVTAASGVRTACDDSTNYALVNGSTRDAYCISKAAGSAGTWSTVYGSCKTAGMRLCNVEEIEQACYSGLIATSTSSTVEWTSTTATTSGYALTVTPSNCASPLPVLATTSGDKTTSKAFRCCYK